EAVRGGDLIEIVNVSKASIRTPRDLVVRDDLISLDHPPLDSIWVRCGESLYGPFRAETPSEDRPWNYDASRSSSRPYQVRLETSPSDHSVYVVPESALHELREAYLGRFEVEVSTDEQN